MDCKGLPKTLCNKKDGCTYRDGAKRKYCAKGKAVVAKKGKVKGHNPCAGLKKTPCNKKPYCQFTQGKRQYCRKRTFKKRGKRNQGGLATPIAPIKMPNKYYQGVSGLLTPVAPIEYTSPPTTSPSYNVHPMASPSYKTPTVKNIQDQIKVNRELAKEIRNFKGKGMTKIRALLKKSDPSSKEVQDALRSLLKKRERLQDEIKRNLAVLKKQKKDAQYDRHKREYKQNKYLLEKSVELYNLVNARR